MTHAKMGALRTPWLMTSFAAAVVILGFSWFGALVSWRAVDQGVPISNDGGAAMATLSALANHGTAAPHAIVALSDRALCIGPYSAAPWTALRAAAVGISIVLSCCVYRLWTLRMALGAGTPPWVLDRVASADAKSMIAWWMGPLVAAFAFGALLPLGAIRVIGIGWVGVMLLAYLPTRAYWTARRSFTPRPWGSALLQAGLTVVVLLGAVFGFAALAGRDAN